jgi:hypothetical protein
VNEQDQQKAQQQSLQQDAEVSAVLAVLLSGPPLATAVLAISAVLKTPGKLVLAVLAGMRYKPGKKTLTSGTDPVAAAKRANLRYRAAYLINAVKRLVNAPDLKTALAREKQLYTAHKQASARRVASAQASVRLSNSTGTAILGWGGIQDARTTPDCLWLIGKNYGVASPPEGLHPGARHPRCRCYPVPPFPGKTVVTALPSHL